MGDGHYSQKPMIEDRKRRRRKKKRRRRERRQTMGDILRRLRIDPVVPLGEIAEDWHIWCWSQFGTIPILTARGLCAYIRHYRTNYHDLLYYLKHVRGGDRMVGELKLYINARIVDQYGLDLHPMTAIDPSLECPPDSEDTRRIIAEIEMAHGFAPPKH